MPSPASAVPLSSFAISSAHCGRRSRPSNAILANFAMPMRSAHPARAASEISSPLASIRQLRKSALAAIGEQKFNLGHDLRDRIELALQILLGDGGIRRPGFGDMARADAEAKHRGRLEARPLDPDRLTDQAALRDDVAIGLTAV